MTTPLKIGFMLWNGQVGGAERHTVALASTIARLGLAETHVAFVDSGQPVLQAMAAEGYPVSASEFRLGRGRSLLLHPPRVALHLQRLGVDALVGPVTGFAALALRTGGFAAALIGVEHGAMLNRHTLPRHKRWMHSASLKLMASSFDGFIAVSDVMAERVRDTLGARVCVATVPNGVDTLRYRPEGRIGDPGSLRIGVAARLVPGKGVREAILAIGLWKAGRAVRLRIAGDGPLRGELEQLARERGVFENVEFLGMVDDMPAFWRDCDLALHATNGLSESFCLAVVEAQASGIPAIVSRAGALPSVIADGETGSVVEPGDVDGLWEAVTAYANDEHLRALHGAAARERASRLFSLERVARDYVSVACDVLQRQS